MLPLVDRPLLAYTFEHLRRLRRHARDRLLRLSADADPGAFRRPLRRAPARVPGRGGAARHRRRDPLRRRGDRRDVRRAQRRLAARGRPRRAGRLPPRAECRRRSCSPRSTTRAATGSSACDERRPGAQLPREAAPRGDRHEPDQRRHLRARAGRAGPDPGGRPVSIEREVFPRLVDEGRSTASRCPATGSTSARPTPTSRRTATCSSATSARSSATARLRLHARRRTAEVTRRPGSCRRSTSARARDRGRRADRQPRCDRCGRHDRRGRSSSRRSSARVRPSAARPSSARSSARGQSSVPVATSAGFRSSALAPEVGDRNMLDHGLRVAADETIAAGAVTFA